MKLWKGSVDPINQDYLTCNRVCRFGGLYRITADPAIYLRALRCLKLSQFLKKKNE